MNESTRANPVYVALESKFSPSSADTPEPVFEISIDPSTQKINLQKAQGGGFLRFETTQVKFIQIEDVIKIELWSIKNNKLLGTLTNKEGQWSTEDLLQIRQELKIARVQIQEKVQHRPGMNTSSNANLYNSFEGGLKDNADIGKVTLILSWAKIGIICLFVVLVFGGVLYLKNSSGFNLNALLNAYYIVGAGLFIFCGVILAELILYVLWATRAYTNLRRLGCNMKFSDRQVGWSFFIPITWWIYPYLIVKEIWKKIQLRIKDVVPEQVVRGAALINIWWAVNVFFQLSVIYVWVKSRILLSKMVDNMHMGGSSTDYFKEAESLSNYNNIVNIIAFIFMFIFPIFFAQILKQEKRLYRIFFKLRANATESESVQ
ncbi:hypothetical protein BKI52_24385 [marine bacterium AO1-C]|nr:hypothetical protein BKI52_24385 [marine bacterium AO1-C]